MFREGLKLAFSLCLLAILLTAARVEGQEDTGSQEGPEVPGLRVIRLDIEAFYGTGSILWPTSSAWRWGLEMGAGISKQVTLAPSEGDFTSVVHVGSVLNRALGNRTGLDLVVRAGLGDIIQVCESSDCYPEPYFLGLLGVDWGSDRVRIGTRISAGRQLGKNVAAWSPLFLRVLF